MVIFSTTENNMIHAYIYIYAHLEILQIRETYPKDLKVAELGFCERQRGILILIVREKPKERALPFATFASGIGLYVHCCSHVVSAFWR